MAGPQLRALFEALAEQAAQVGTAVADSLARLSEQTAELVEANLARTLRTDAQIGADFDRIGRFADRRPAPVAGRIPLGFPDSGSYNDFVGVLNRGLTEAGYHDTRAAFQGSSVTGVSYLQGLPFRPESDYDIALGGPDLFHQARQLGLPLRSGGTRTGPLSSAQAEALGLSALQTRLRQLAGREVNFMIFDTIGRAVDRRPSRLAVPVEDSR
jgi:hypothetical protein